MKDEEHHLSDVKTVASTVLDKAGSVPWQGLMTLKPGLDVAGLAQRYMDRHGDYDEGAFVVWLAGKGHISGAQLAAWAAGQQVDGADIDAALDTVHESADGRATMAFSSSQQFELLSELGRGGMGSVFLARDGRLGRTVALKRLTEAPTVDTARRFVREVQITAQLEHPHIVPVYTFEVLDGEPVFVMKLVQGRSLDTVLEDICMAYERHGVVSNEHSLDQRLEVFTQVCGAVSYAHSKGVLHRDIKPANVMLGDHGEVYLVDWGVAHLLKRGEGGDVAVEGGALSLDGASLQAEETHVGLAGTPLYMSPEQALRLESIAEPSDQFALGLLLYELVTLRRAYRAKTAQEAMDNAARAELRPIVHRYGAPIARELKAIIRRATARDVGARYPSVAALMDDLRSFQRGLPVSALEETRWQRVGRWMRRNRRWALGTLLPLAVLLPALAILSASSTLSADVQHEMVERLSDQLRSANVDRVRTALDAHLKPQRLVIQENLDRVAIAGETLADDRRWVKQFWSQLRRYPGLKYAYFGTAADGRYTSVARHPDGLEFSIGRQTRKLLPDGSAGEFVSAIENYDPRVRPWYVAAATAKQPRWPKPYIYRDLPDLYVSLAAPVYDKAGKLLGVFGADRTLQQLDQFMHGLEIGKTGRAYIVDREGCLVAASVPLGKRTACDAPGNSPDPLIKATAAELKRRFDASLSTVSKDTAFKFQLKNEEQMVQLAPFNTGDGIDWVIVVALPRSDLTEHLEEHSRTTWILSLGLILAALLMGLLIWLRARDASRD